MRGCRLYRPLWRPEMGDLSHFFANFTNYIPPDGEFRCCHLVFGISPSNTVGKCYCLIKGCFSHECVSKRCPIDKKFETTLFSDFCSFWQTVTELATPLWLGTQVNWTTLRYIIHIQITVVRKNGFFSTSPWWNISTKAFPEHTHQAGRFEMRRGAFTVFTLEMWFVKEHIKQDLLLFYYSIMRWW